MDITKRQRRILEIVVRDYIDSAEPISSRHIEKNYNLGVSPATIRNDLKKLVEEGYLTQPHSSAGRIPSDKGYRYFVNKLLKRENALINSQLERRIAVMEKQVENEVKFLRELTGFLAGLSSSLTYSYLLKKNLYWKEGFEEALLYPEFEDIEKIHSFLELTKRFEKEFENQFSDSLEENEVKIYIGKENPFEAEDFSILISRCKFSKDREGVLAILGPKRMAYGKNISLINSLVKLLENGHDERREEKRRKDE